MPIESLRIKLILAALAWGTGAFLLSAALSLALFLTHIGAAHPGKATRLIELIPWLIAGSGVLLFAGLALVRAGVRPLHALRDRVLEIRRGTQSRLFGSYPTEVQPLVEEVNDLLAQTQADLDRARAEAADLAHALKTPIAVVANETSRFAAEGRGQSAALILDQVRTMQRTVEGHLARARAAGSARLGLKCFVAPLVERMCRAMTRLHETSGIGIRSAVSAEAWFRGDAGDFEEMLGNLLDNGSKWCLRRVEVGLRLSGEFIVLVVDDDGAGLTAEARHAVFVRGLRLDQKASGSGLGLAITRQIAEAYAGRVELTESPLGGLRAEIWLPGGAPASG
jgi:signal transduction histidine kinase